MNKVFSVIGLIAGLLMILSSVAHSFFGWQAIRMELVAAHVSGDLLLGVQLGWQFGGAAILTFGVIVVAIFWKSLQGRSTSTFPAAVIGLVYIGFGLWAFFVTSFDPFYMVFIIPGLMSLGSAAGSSRN